MFLLITHQKRNSIGPKFRLLRTVSPIFEFDWIGNERCDMGVGKIIPGDKVKPTDRDVYWVEVNGSPVEKVPLKKSREVALEPIKRTIARGYSSHISRAEFRSQSHKVRSARLGQDSGGITSHGIQIYRLWFSFLKLALELEDMGVTKLVTKQTRQRRDAPSGGHVRKGGANIGTQWQLKDTVPFKIKREKYEGWDLEQVLKDPFNKWWKGHGYLFEGYTPQIVQSTGYLDPDFLYIRIDRTSKLEDVRDFITKEIQPQLSGKPRFEIDGYPRPDVLQNQYNALVLTMKGWTAQDICTGGPKEAIYLRATDRRSNDDRLSVGTVKGKKLWSSAVTKQRNGGLHHLQEVMKGRFGSQPSDSR